VSPLTTMSADPGCWLPQSMLPEIELSAPRLPVAVAAAVVSVKLVLRTRPVAALKLVTPLPTNVRSRSVEAEPVPTRTSTWPARAKITICGPLVPAWPRNSISGPSSEGRLHMIVWAVTSPVRPAVPVIENWAVAGPLVGAGEGVGAVLGALDGVGADEAGVPEPGTVDAELPQAARTKPTTTSGAHLRQPTGRKDRLLSKSAA
jgi:hypothetical protein